MVIPFNCGSVRSVSSDIHKWILFCISHIIIPCRHWKCRSSNAVVASSSLEGIGGRVTAMCSED